MSSINLNYFGKPQEPLKRAKGILKSVINNIKKKYRPLKYFLFGGIKSMLLLITILTDLVFDFI